jgi:hypothetical protein
MTFSPFDKLNIEPKLACEFLGVFSRSEYALKKSGFHNDKSQDAKADWDKFAKNINDQFNAIEDKDTKAAIEYLLKNPPKKQVCGNDGIQWKDTPRDLGCSSVEFTLTMIRRVRNNLFHGGKYLESVPGRDKLLVEHSLRVLHACISFNQKVRTAYEND